MNYIHMCKIPLGPISAIKGMGPIEKLVRKGISCNMELHSNIIDYATFDDF